jgi:hypothetical protein
MATPSASGGKSSYLRPMKVGATASKDKAAKPEESTEESFKTATPKTDKGGKKENEIKETVSLDTSPYNGPSKLDGIEFS